MAQAPDWENKQPPSAEQAETAFLGACLLTPQAIVEGHEAGLLPDHFYHPAHRQLWSVMLERFAGDLPCDIVLIHQQAGEAHDWWQGPGGWNHLLDIQTSCPLPAYAPSYAAEIIEAAAKRQAYNIALKAVQNPEAALETLQTNPIPQLKGEDKRILHYSDGNWAEKIQERYWLIPDWLMQGVICHLAAPGGIGKSRLILQTAAGLATGNTWLPKLHNAPHNLYAPNNDNTPRRVHIATWEDDISIFASRLNLMEYADTGDMLSISEETEHLWQTEDDYDNVGHPSASMKSLMRLCRDEAIDLLVIDPVVAAYGGSENNRQQVRAFLNTLQTMIRDMAGAISVMLVSHTPKSATTNPDHVYSGSTDWINGVRSFWSMKTETNPDDKDIKATRLRLEKSNHSIPYPHTPDIWIAGWPRWAAMTRHQAEHEGKPSLAEPTMLARPRKDIDR